MVVSKHDHPSTRHLRYLKSKDHIYNLDINQLLGAKVFKPSKILIKTSNAPNTVNQIFKVLRHQESMILSSSIYYIS